MCWCRGRRVERTAPHLGGPVLSGSSGLARSLSDIVRSAGAPRIAESVALFRVEVPAGQTLNDLVPADRWRLSRHGAVLDWLRRARPPDAGCGTAVGTGAAIALGPLVGLMALSVGADMLARHQQEQQLKAIRQGVEALLKRQRQGDVAVLQTGEDGSGTLIGPHAVAVRSVRSRSPKAADSGVRKMRS